MLTTKKARKVLTKKQQKHLTKMNIRSIAVFKASRAAQDEMREKSLATGTPIGLAEPCWDCCHIARKLGIGP